MRILWVKSGGLVPLDHGGKIRSFHLAKELAARHNVELFTFYAQPDEDCHSSLSSIFSKVYAIPLRIPDAQSGADYRSYARNLLSRRPYSMTKYCQPIVGRRLRELLQGQKFDVFLCDFLLTAAVVPWEVRTPKVLFTHNVEAMIWERRYRVTRNPIWKAVSYREYVTIERFERQCLKKADHVLAVSEFDRDFFLRFLQADRLSVIPTGVDVNFFQPFDHGEVSNRLVFTGSMDWMPNEDGISWFVDEILPRVQSKKPDVSLYIVGRRPSVRLQKLMETHSNVVVTGAVQDIRPYLQQGSVYVVPLRVGGGTRLKIFEAMASGKPIVSTTIGAEGLPVNHGKDIYLADRPDEFASYVLDLMTQSELRRQVGRDARQLVEKNHSWTAVAATLDEVLTKVVKDYRA